MDYTHSFFAGNPPFTQPFIGIPPLTPSHSNSAASDDYNTTSPPEVFEFNNDAFSAFDGYAAVQFNPHQQPVFPGPPTPPGQQHLAHAAAVHVPAAPQDPSHQQPPQPQQQHAPAPAAAAAARPARAPQPGAALPITKVEPGTDDLAWQQQQQEQNQRGSNSDDDELTPAQSRRKAQNRAAQRAFRERKERHVKDLEALNASLKETQQQIASENERLKRDLQKISTENEILRATSSLHAAAAAAAASPTGDPTAAGLPLAMGPMTYNPTDFYTDLLANHDNKSPSHRVATSPSGERLLAAGATWDLIINHELYRRGLVDVADISNRLKHQAKCDGQGPVFEESVILEAIEQSVSSGSDSLL